MKSLTPVSRSKPAVHFCTLGAASASMKYHRDPRHARPVKLDEAKYNPPASEKVEFIKNSLLIMSTKGRERGGRRGGESERELEGTC